MYQCNTGYCEKAEQAFECKQGHTNRLCGVCTPGWALTGLSCTECIDSILASFITIVLVFIIIAVLIAMVYQRVASAIKRARGGRRSLSSSIQRIFMTYAQTVSILSASKTQPPEEVTRVVATTSTFTDGISASAYPVQCAFGDDWTYYHHVFFYMAAPIIAIIIPLLAAGPAFVVWRVFLRPYFMQVRMKRMGERVTETPTRQSTHSGISVALGRLTHRSMKQAAAAMSRRSSSEELKECGGEGLANEANEEAPEHPLQWFFLDEYGTTQGPCQHAHLKSWLETNALPSTTLIIPVESTAAEDWRPLSEINKRTKRTHRETSDADDMQAWLAQQRSRGEQAKVVVSAMPIEKVDAADAAVDAAADAADADAAEGSEDDALESSSRKKKRYGRGTVLFNTIDLGGADAKGRRVSMEVYGDQFKQASKHLSRRNLLGDAGADGSVATLGDAEKANAADDGAITRSVLSCVLPPGIKPTDIDRMIKKFGYAIDPAEMDRTKAEKLNWVRKQAFRARKGRIKRNRVRALKKTHAGAGHWERFVDLKRDKVFYLHSRTRERREEAPAGSAFAAGMGDVEMVVSPMSRSRGVVDDVVDDAEVRQIYSFVSIVLFAILFVAH
jgi:hypothetical protein